MPIAADPGLLRSSYGYSPTMAKWQAVNQYYGLPVSAMRSPAGDGGGAHPAATMGIPGTGTPYTPEQYRQMALSDPIYQAWVSNVRDPALANAGTNRTAALRALAMTYGGLPKDFADTYGDLTPDILAQAAANPESQMAQMQRAYDAQNAIMQNQLAARGALHSGDLVQGQQTLDQQFQADQANAATAFLQAVSGDPVSGNLGIFGRYGQDVTDAWSGQTDALTQAIQDQEALFPSGGGGQSASLIPDSQSTYGQAVYQGPDGALYAIDPATGQLTPYNNPISTLPAYTTPPTIPVGSVY